jgi:Fur family transcriptional regulator, ferric uptake regulator
VADSASERTSGPPAEAWIEFAERELRVAGHRSSLPRTSILELIGRQDCVLTAQEIADRLRAGDRPVGVATVYRTLDLLEELKLVQRLDIGGGSARYEPALPGGAHHHHHLVCDRCGRVTPFEDEPLEHAIEMLAKRLDYEVGEHDVILKGRCPRCGVTG